jgi:hypothetical protein
MQDFLRRIDSMNRVTPRIGQQGTGGEQTQTCCYSHGIISFPDLDSACLLPTCFSLILKGSSAAHSS